MLGFRGAVALRRTRRFRPCFELECRALKRVRESMGLTNVAVMVPFVRTVAEARQVTELLAANGLKRGEDGLKIIMMCELPTNALLADQYLEHFDGMSIGSNDMTQLTLGLDRDSAIVAQLFDERDDGREGACCAMAIKACRKARQVHRHLRPGTVRPPGPGALAARAGHREHVAQPRHRGRDLAVPGAAAQVAGESRVFRRSNEKGCAGAPRTHRDRCRRRSRPRRARPWRDRGSAR